MSTTIQWDSLDDLFGITAPSDEDACWHTAEVDAAIVAEDCHRLCQLVQEGDEHARSIFDQINRVMAFASAHDFDALLRLLSGTSFAAEEYSGIHCVFPPWCLSQGCRGLRIHGTLPALAVALNRADLLEQLLRQGCHTELPSPAPCLYASIYDGLWNLHIIWNEIPPDEMDALFGNNLTALALAVLLGHGDCVEVLLRHGATMECNFVLGNVMYLGFREKDGEYRRARELVLAHGDRASHKPILSDLYHCSTRQFREVLQSYHYTSQEWDKCQGLLDPDEVSWKNCHQRLAEICKVYPDALSNPFITDVVFAHAANPDFDPAPLLRLAEGCKVDLTMVDWNYIPVARMRTLLNLLSERSTLTADRMQFFRTVSSERLRLLLKYVHFYASERTAPISDLSSSLLLFGSTPLIRHALETGVINESTKDLVTFLSGSFVPERARAAVLTVKRDPALLLPDFEGE